MKKTKSADVEESMTKVKLHWPGAAWRGSMNVRVWDGAAEVPSERIEEVVKIAWGSAREGLGGSDTLALARLLLKAIPTANAVEALDDAGNGHVRYRNWP